MKKKPTSLRRSMFMRLGFNFYDVAVTIFCVAFGLLCFYPLWYCLVASVMPYEEYVKGGLMLWFKGIDLQYYIQIFSTKVYTNSLLDLILPELVAMDKVETRNGSDLEIPERRKSLALTRDLFLFACYTGTAYAVRNTRIHWQNRSMSVCRY